MRSTCIILDKRSEGLLVIDFNTLPQPLLLVLGQGRQIDVVNPVGGVVGRNKDGKPVLSRAYYIQRLGACRRGGGRRLGYGGSLGGYGWRRLRSHRPVCLAEQRPYSDSENQNPCGRKGCDRAPVHKLTFRFLYYLKLVLPYYFLNI